MGIFLHGEAKLAEISTTKLAPGGRFFRQAKNWPNRVVQVVLLHRYAKVHVLNMAFFLEYLQSMIPPTQSSHPHLKF